MASAFCSAAGSKPGRSLMEQTVDQHGLLNTPAAMSALAGRLPRARLHVLPGAAPMTPFSDPGQLALLISRAAPG